MSQSRGPHPYGNKEQPEESFGGDIHLDRKGGNRFFLPPTNSWHQKQALGINVSAGWARQWHNLELALSYI